HNLVLEVTRLGIENKNLKMRVESLNSRMDFDERRARALETVVQYKSGSGPSHEPRPAPSRYSGEAPRHQPQSQQPRPVHQPPPPQQQVARAESPQEATAEQAPPVVPSQAPGTEQTADSSGTARRRRRRRRGRRGGRGRAAGEEMNVTGATPAAGDDA